MKQLTLAHHHTSLGERASAFGLHDLIWLDQGLTSPAQLNYLDLLPRSGGAARITAVAEHQGTALLYLVDGADDPLGDELPILQRTLANRSDPAWLGVVTAGTLEIYPIGFHAGRKQSKPVAKEKAGTANAPLFFQSLVHGTFAKTNPLKSSDYVFESIFHLLEQTSEAFVPTELLEPLDVLSLSGRALFFRFLLDRKIVIESDLPEVCPAAKTNLRDAFASAEHAAQTSAWLDVTFNGDFLRLIDESIPHDDHPARLKAYLDFYQRIDERTSGKIFLHLQAILNGWRDMQPELPLDWNDFDFAHIPVGVLSQVYESFSHRADRPTAKRTSVHYTPRTIVRLMVDEAFAAVKEKSAAQVLDPSCGAGIFLVLTFRRLVHEHWLSKGERPDTRAIQRILYQQLRGFDISESALRLAALGLYITAIELNASTRPPKSLKFPKNLRDTVLHHFGDEHPQPGVYPLGSLGSRVPAEFDQAFDIVIGNPPWTRLREDDPINADTEEEDDAPEEQAGQRTEAANDVFTQIARRVLAGRDLDALATSYENPDNNPDLPFLWRSMEWAKHGGVIALAMPARLFQRTSGKGLEVWRAIMRSVAITGLMNGADLRKTAVWDAVDMPFCLLFARNAKPASDQHFYFSTPSYDPKLNHRGLFRIDYESAYPISTARVERQPWILKALSLGTWLDVEVMESILTAFPQTLGQYWQAWDAPMVKTGQGYNISPKLKQNPDEFLADLKDFKKPEAGFVIEYHQLRTFFDKHNRKTAHMPRTEALYQPPLVIVPKSPGDDPKTPKAYLSTQTLAFSQIYYGYSCAGHPEGETLACLIHIVAHSALFRYFAPLVSSSQGSDRMMFTKKDLDALPFPDPSKLNARTKATIRTLAHRLETEATKPWDELNDFIFKLYGLDETSAQVIRDTLFSAASYRKQGRDAFAPPMTEHRDAFSAELREALEPFFEVCGESLTIREPAFQQDVWREPWFFIELSRGNIRLPTNLSLLNQAMDAANESAASRIIVRAPNQAGLLLGVLSQRRWWTRSRARLIARHLINHCLDAFGLPDDT